MLNTSRIIARLFALIATGVVLTASIAFAVNPIGIDCSAMPLDDGKDDAGILKPIGEAFATHAFEFTCSGESLHAVFGQVETGTQVYLGYRAPARPPRPGASGDPAPERRARGQCFRQGIARRSSHCRSAVRPTPSAMTTNSPAYIFGVTRICQ